MNLFPNPEMVIKLRDAIRDCDTSGLPSFDDKYAKLWARILVPRGRRLTTSAYHVIGKGWNNCVKPNPDMPCCTLPKMQTGRGYMSIVHWAEQRALSIGEAKRISSFFDSFQLVDEDYETQWALIGNAVPPLFMFAIAGTIRERFFGNYTMPNRNGNEYLDILEAAWQDHLKPKEPDAPTVISLFAGCGGSSLGYSMAGYRELLAVEWDDNAVATFKLNFPDVPVYHGDIHDLSVDECLEMTGLQPGELDVLDGSPPCQGFSTAGKRQMDDPRNQLSMEYVRLLRGLKPKVFIMENVSGLVKGKMKLVFAEIMRELKASGYDVKCRLMNAMYFNVPQSRQRLIWIGVRDRLGVEVGHPKGERILPVKLCYQIGGDELKGIELERWQHIPPGGNWQHLPKHLVNGLAKYSNFHRRLHPDKPSFTVGKEEHYSSGRFYHWLEPRRINDRELSRIGSFPDEFDYIEHGKGLHYRVGNSVPPLFMKAIAQYVRQEILSLVF